MATPLGPDVRPPHLKFRDLIVAVIMLVVGLLLAFGVLPDNIVAVLTHDAWRVAFVFLGGSGGAFLYAYLDRRFGQEVGGQLREVSEGVKDGHTAALELARSKVPKGDGAPSGEMSDPPTNPIEIRRE